MPGKNPGNRYPKKNHAIRNVENGAMIQLRKSVNPTGFGVLAAFRTWPKSIFTMIGYTMKNSAMAMGIDTLKTVYVSRVTANWGIIRPKKMPAMMQINTNIVKYFSKNDKFLLVIFLSTIILASLNHFFTLIVILYYINILYKIHIFKYLDILIYIYKNDENRFILFQLKWENLVLKP
ncbi:MAG: hypothetical protein Kow0019_09130 [Methanobacteriaceae archaeon]